MERAKMECVMSRDTEEQTAGSHLPRRAITTRPATLAGRDAYRKVGGMIRIYGAVHVIVSMGRPIDGDEAEDMGHGGIGECRPATLRLATVAEGTDCGLSAADMRALYAAHALTD